MSLGPHPNPVWVQQRDAWENLDWIFVFHSGFPPPCFVNSSFQFSTPQVRKLQVRLDGCYFLTLFGVHWDKQQLCL